MFGAARAVKGLSGVQVAMSAAAKSTRCFICLVCLLCGAVFSGTTAAAQVLPRPQAAPPGVPRADSVKSKAIAWAPLDSTGMSLMTRPGVTVVRYQADEVVYRAKDGYMTLTGIKGARAVVEQEPTSLVADTIEFAQKVDSLRARGDTIVMHDPAKGDDMVARGFLSYDLANREGTAGDVSTSTKTGQLWNVAAHRAAFSAADSASGRENTFYGANGIITSCTDSIPHYHFAAGEIKRISNDMVVARNVVMHIMGVPVFWLPFMFQDARTGRRSGILTPRFGLTELVRNSPFYRRTVENVGYYFAFSDYADFAASLDWRSSANATSVDPGWVRWNGQVNYRWLNRFATGRIGGTLHNLSSGSSNTQLSWTHSQDFSIHSHLTANLNLSTSTTVQRQTAIAPLASLATIASQANYDRDLGPLKLSIGGTRRQYPGRKQVDEDFPSLNLTSKPIGAGDWFTWTPSLNVASSASNHLDSQGDFAKRFISRSDGTIDSTQVDRNTHRSSFSLNSPFKVFDFQIQASLRASDRSNDYPELRTVINPVDTSKRSTRIYEKTWLSEVDFDFGMNLPQLFRGTLNLSPSITMANIGPGAFSVRTERTGSKWVTQGKRLSYGLGISPTFFALYGGFGPVARIRHTVTTSLSYSYSPHASLSPEYLGALGQTQVGFLGENAQNRVTLSIQQLFEGKLSVKGDTVKEENARKIKLLSLGFSPITWDFERARLSKSKSGFATDRMDISLRSDLLPGFDVGVGYSLFQGNILSDTAVFSPYLESVRASFSLGAGSGIGSLLGKLFGGPEADQPRDTTTRPGTPVQRTVQQSGAGQAGQSIRGSSLAIPTGKAFEAQISFSLSQQRPPVGGHIVEYDPTLQCLAFKDVNPFQYDLCVRNALAAPPADVNSSQTTAGGSFFRVPPQINVQGSTSFNLTEKWAARWSTNYDFQQRQFGLQSVTLQRDMHDWKAVFGFTQAPNGAFTFTFFVSLTAEPDIKFDYNRATYGAQNGGIPR